MVPNMKYSLKFLVFRFISIQLTVYSLLLSNCLLSSKNSSIELNFMDCESIKSFSIFISCIFALIIKPVNPSPPIVAENFS